MMDGGGQAETGRSVTAALVDTGPLKGGQSTVQVGDELFLAETKQDGMSIAVTTDLVACFTDPADKVGVAFGRPTQHEKGGSHLVACQQSEAAFGVWYDPRFLLIPLRWWNVLQIIVTVKPLLYIDGDDIDCLDYRASGSRLMTSATQANCRYFMSHQRPRVRMLTRRNFHEQVAWIPVIDWRR